MFKNRGFMGSPISRLLVMIAAGAALVVGGALPAAGITYGQPDGGAHPNVGAMLLVRERVDPATGETVTTVRRDCSGSLIDERVFLTAGHCVAWMDDIANPRRVYVTFEEKPPLSDPEAMQELMIAVEDMSHAGFAGFETDDGDARDLGLLFLAEAPDVDPVRLVDPGALDRLSRHQRDALVFTSVGYGVVREGEGAPTFIRRAERMKADGSLLALTRNWLTISQNPALGDGGTCYGDSGGPIFTTIADEYVVTGVASTGDAMCQATNKAYRVDSAVGRSYLGSYFGP